jgi:hypothetical protein
MGTISELRFCTRSCLVPLCAHDFAHAGHNHLNNLALCGSLVRVHGLRVKGDLSS